LRAEMFKRTKYPTPHKIITLSKQKKFTIRSYKKVAQSIGTQ